MAHHPKGNANYQYVEEDFPDLPHWSKQHPSSTVDSRKQQKESEHNTSTSEPSFLELKTMLLAMQSQINVLHSHLSYPTQFQAPRQEGVIPFLQHQK